MTTTSVETESFPILIGGQWRTAIDGDTFETSNPATGEVLGRVPRCRSADIAAAVEAGEEAFPDWRATPPSERAAHRKELADALIERKEELALVDADDNGSPISDLRIDVSIGAAELRYFAGLALESRGETIPTSYERLNYTLREPFGVVARIIP